MVVRLGPWVVVVVDAKSVENGNSLGLMDHAEVPFVTVSVMEIIDIVRPALCVAEFADRLEVAPIPGVRGRRRGVADVETAGACTLLGLIASASCQAFSLGDCDAGGI